jgi:hypothetical protein
VIREGVAKDEILKLVDEDPDIRMLVLAAAPGSDGPGPLVSELAGQKAGNLNFLISIIPGGLTDEQIDRLT